MSDKDPNLWPNVATAHRLCVKILCKLQTNYERPLRRERAKWPWALCTRPDDNLWLWISRMSSSALSLIDGSREKNHSIFFSITFLRNCKHFQWLFYRQTNRMRHTHYTHTHTPHESICFDFRFSVFAYPRLYALTWKAPASAADDIDHISHKKGEECEGKKYGHVVTISVN